jgi:polyisoprenyl-phosphate glycosyltransferase
MLTGMLSVVAPAYNEGESLQTFISRVVATLEETGEDWEAIIVDDGSRDTTWEAIQHAAADDDRVRGIRLSRNFGHQLALTAGMTVARGDRVITLDSDLQHPPEVIPALLSRRRQLLEAFHCARLLQAAQSPVVTRVA